MAADIRPAHADDLRALVEIEGAAFETDRLSNRSFRRLTSSGTAAVLVAVDRNAMLGYCAVLFRAGSRKARLYSIAVRADSESAGIGRTLLSAAEREAMRRGAMALRLEVRECNARAIGLYERAGYFGIGRLPDYYADGAAALRYEKRLSPPLAPSQIAQEPRRRDSR